MKKKICAAMAVMLLFSGVSLSTCCAEDEISTEAQSDNYRMILPAEDYFSKQMSIDEIIDSESGQFGFDKYELNRDEILNSRSIVETQSGSKYAVYEIRRKEGDVADVSAHFFFLDNTLQAAVYDYEITGDMAEAGVLSLSEFMNKAYGTPAPLTVSELGALAEVTSDYMKPEDNMDSYKRENVVIATKEEGNHVYVGLYRLGQSDDVKAAKTQGDYQINLEGLSEDEIGKVNEYLEYLKYEETQKANAYIEYLKSLRGRQ